MKMKAEHKKKPVTVKTLKDNVKKYLKLEKEGENAKEWYASCAVNNLLKNLEITLDYVNQMNKQEFDRTVLFAMKLIYKFQSEELARTFIWKYFEFYKGCSDEERIYKDAILPIFEYIENNPNYNRLGFTKEMKEIMRSWKGKTLQSYIENSDDGYVTIVRFCIENQVFDVDNGYTAYWHSKESIEELSCFSCVGMVNNQPLESSVVGGKSKEHIVGEQIRDIYIINDVEKEINANDEKVYEFSYETAFVLQTESRCYAFWRHLIFDKIETAICQDMENALKTIKSSEEIQKEAQEENPYPVTVERLIEQL